MLRQGLALALGAGLLAGIAGQADAANSFIVLRGCAHYQVPACTILNSGGHAYSLHNASPPVPLNVGVTVYGTVSGDLDLCFATPVKVVKWKRNRLRCPR